MSAVRTGRTPDGSQVSSNQDFTFSLSVWKDTLDNKKLVANSSVIFTGVGYQFAENKKRSGEKEVGKDTEKWLWFHQVPSLKSS